jgi:spermidine/putrescine transport system ATP-binding protein
MALYDAPVNRYVADFVGESNFFAGDIVDADAAGASLRTSSGLTLTAPYAAGGQPLTQQSRGVIAVRPEVVRLWRDAAPADAARMDCTIQGRIQNRIYLGDQTEFSITTAALGTILVRAGKTGGALSDDFSPGREVNLGWYRHQALVLVDG